MIETLDSYISVIEISKKLYYWLSVDESSVLMRSGDSGTSKFRILLILFAEISKLSVSSPAEEHDETETFLRLPVKKMRNANWF